METGLELRIKETDSLLMVCRLINNLDMVADIKELNIYAELRTLGGYLVEILEVIPTLTSGKFSLKSNSSILPAGTLIVDILFENKTTKQRLSSQTFKIIVERAITKGTVV